MHWILLLLLANMAHPMQQIGPFYSYNECIQSGNDLKKMISDDTWQSVYFHCIGIKDKP
jgi:hypothetical protein